MQQGKLNWSQLYAYVFKSADFGTYDSYLRALIGDLQNVRNTFGVVSGCNVTAVSALTVAVSAGIVIFPSGVLASVPAQNVTLPAANSTNGRIDRLELIYSSTQNQVIVTSVGVSGYLDNLINGTPTPNVGTPASSPAMNAKTVGAISIAAITVPAAAANLISSNIDQTVDVSKEISAIGIGPQGSLIRFNDTLKLFQMSPDGIVWTSLAASVIPPQKFPIANNQTSAVNLAGLILDSTKYVGLKFYIQIAIQTSTAVLVEQGPVHAIYRPDGTYQITQPTSFDDAGVVLSITSGGQIQYTSGNVAGSAYTGFLRTSGIEPVLI